MSQDKQENKAKKAPAKKKTVKANEAKPVKTFDKVITNGITFEDVLYLDQEEKCELEFSDDPKLFLELDEDQVRELSHANRIRYGLAKQSFKNREKGDRIEGLSVSQKVPEMLGGASNNYTTALSTEKYEKEHPDMHFCYKNRLTLDKDIANGYMVVKDESRQNDPDSRKHSEDSKVVFRNVNPDNGHKEELVLCAIPKKRYDEHQIAVALKSKQNIDAKTNTLKKELERLNAPMINEEEEYTTTIPVPDVD